MHLFLYEQISISIVSIYIRFFSDAESFIWWNLSTIIESKLDLSPRYKMEKFSSIWYQIDSIACRGVTKDKNSAIRFKCRDQPKCTRKWLMDPYFFLEFRSARLTMWSGSRRRKRARNYLGIATDVARIWQLCDVHLIRIVNTKTKVITTFVVRMDAFDLVLKARIINVSPRAKSDWGFIREEFHTAVLYWLGSQTIFAPEDFSNLIQ